MSIILTQQQQEDIVPYELAFPLWWDEQFAEICLYCAEMKQWYWYDNTAFTDPHVYRDLREHPKEGIFYPVDRIFIRAQARGFFLMVPGYKFSKTKLTTCMDLVEERSLHSFAEFDQSGLLCLMNGMFDVTTQVITPHHPGYLATKKIPIMFTPEPELTPCIDSFRDYFPDQMFQIERFIQALLHQYWGHEQMLNLFGPTSAGKGTILDLIRTAFTGQCVVNDIHDLGGAFGYGPLLGKLICIDPDMGIKGFNNDTIGTIKVLTGGDALRGDGITINIKFMRQFSACISILLITATNQFGVLPNGVNHQAWFRRMNIVVLDHSFPANPVFKTAILLEVHDWISELLLMPFQDWTKGMDKVVWAKRQQAIYERSSRVYQTIATEHFEYISTENLCAYDVVTFFRKLLREREYWVPPEHKLMGYITNEFAALNIRKMVVGRARKPVYMNVRPLDYRQWEAITENDPTTDEINPTVELGVDEYGKLDVN